MNVIVNFVVFSQLFYDGFPAIAAELANSIRTDPPCPPSNRLYQIMINGMQNEKKDVEVDDSFLDLEFQADGTPSAPEPASYETAYVTSHKHACRAGCFSFDGQLVATGSLDASIKILDVDRMLAKSAPDEINDREQQQGHPVIRTLYDHTDEVAYLEFHPSNVILASGSRDCTVKLFDISKASVKKSHKTFTDCEPVRCLS